MRKTVHADHIDPKQKVVCTSDNLDFSFTKLEDVESLKTKEPRAGKRKPIEEFSDEEEENKNESM